MEPIIKSEPCEDLYTDQDSGNQVPIETQPYDTALLQPQQQNNLKRCYEKSQDILENPESIQPISKSGGKPSKKYKRLEENVLFNPPFFTLVEEVHPPLSNNAIAARCYSCFKIVKGNRGISSNFIKHMKRAHAEIYNLYDAYKSNKIKSHHLPNLTKIIKKKYAPLAEKCASGSDSTTANSNDDTNQCFEVDMTAATSCLNDSSDENDDLISATKDIVHFEFSTKNLETLENIIEKKLKTLVKQTEYEQLKEKVNTLTNHYKNCDVDGSPILKELKAELDNVKKECSELRSAIQITKASKRQLQNELRTVDKLLHQRKLIIRNIPVCDSDNPLKSVEKLFRETMKLGNIQILNCCILPSCNSSMETNKENVSIELVNSKDCKAIFRQTQKLKNTGIFIECETSPFQRKRKNKLMVLRKELLRRKPALKVLLRDTTLIVNSKKFYWDDVEGLCHDDQCEEAVDLSGVEYMKLLCGLDIKEFIVVLQNYDVQIP